MKAVVQMSGGTGSYGAAQRTIAEFGRDNVTLLFADVLIEDEDLYRFLDEVCELMGIPLTRICDGRNPWEVFRDVKFIGNTRIDPCSAQLKRDLLRAWINEHCDPADTTVMLGIDWTEIERLDKAIHRWAPFTVRAPLCEDPLIDKDDLHAEINSHGIEIPNLNKLGFPHNNCGGFCVKAGQAQFKLLYETMPERYAWHEEQEQITRVHIGKKVAILRDRRGGETKPMSMTQFRRRLEGLEPGEIDLDDWGGCGCALD